MKNVTEVSHPLIAHHLVRLRDSTTSPADFRLSVGRLAVLLAYEATKDLTTESKTVSTPLTDAQGSVLSQRVGIVPILRAGLGMVEPVLNLIPDSEVWHVGLYRDEQTAKPIEYYSRIPQVKPMDVALVLDPMLATGGSASATIEALVRRDIPTIKMLAVIASQDGIDRVNQEFPETQIFVCAIDPELNDQKFIVPGLGDAGDRIFNTPTGEG
jgi:uracil phosphoribosyltransferase